MAMPSQLTPLDPEETGAELDPLPVEADSLEPAELLLEELLLEALLLEALLLEEELAAATGAALVPTAMTVAWAGLSAVRETSVFAVSAPFVVVTS